MCGNESIMNQELRFFMYGGEKIKKIEKIEKIWGYLHEGLGVESHWRG